TCVQASSMAGLCRADGFLSNSSGRTSKTGRLPIIHSPPPGLYGGCDAGSTCLVANQAGRGHRRCLERAGVEDGMTDQLRAAALLAATITMGIVTGVLFLYASTIMPG